jgi:tetratricopeptide (TPR) repeat protein
MNIEKAKKLYDDGLVHYRNGKWSEAERSLKKAIRLNPEFPDAHNDLANVYLKKGRLKESFNEYRKALGFAPNHPMLLNNIGNVLMTQRDFKQALKWFNRALEQDPQNAITHCNLGSTLRGLGDDAGAASAYRRAIELNPRETTFINNLGEVLIELGEPDEAVECFSKALEIDPRQQRSMLGLGKAWNARGNLARAVECYRQAIEIDPANAQCFIGLGAAYGDHGEIDEAVASLRKAIEINPRQVSAYPVLARYKTFTAGDDDIRAMETLFSAKESGDTDKSRLAFSLGKAYEDIGEYDKSIKYVIKGARLKRKQIDYSNAATRERFERIKQVFSADFFARCADVGFADRTPIFIIGMPRSGTSLVEQILASHPAVFGAGELDDLSRVYRSLGESAAGAQTDNFPEDLVELDPDRFEDLGSEYIRRIRRLSADASFITDKLPHNFMRVGFIRAILPRARIIHCTREPMDTCLSLFKTDFHRGQFYSYDMAELGEYYRLYRELMDFWRTVLPDFGLDLKYEQLVNDPQGQTRALLEYCDLPWDDACLDFHRSRRKIRTASSAQVVRPIYRDSVDLWKRYEKYLQPLAAALGS